MLYSPQSGEGGREAKRERIIPNSARTTSHTANSWQELVPRTGRKHVWPLRKAAAPPGKSSAGAAASQPAPVPAELSRAAGPGVLPRCHPHVTQLAWREASLPLTSCRHSQHSYLPRNVVVCH